MGDRYDRSRSPPRGGGRTNDDAKLYVGNINYQMGEPQLRDIFSKYGTVIDVHMPLEKSTGRPRGFCFVKYDNPRDAEEALRLLNGSEHLGRTMRVVKAAPRDITDAMMMKWPQRPGLDSGGAPPRGRDDGSVGRYDEPRGGRYYDDVRGPPPPRSYVDDRAVPRYGGDPRYDDRGYYDRPPRYDDRYDPPRYDDRGGGRYYDDRTEPLPRYDDRYDDRGGGRYYDDRAAAPPSQYGASYYPPAPRGYDDRYDLDRGPPAAGVLQRGYDDRYVDPRAAARYDDRYADPRAAAAPPYDVDPRAAATPRYDVDRYDMDRGRIMDRRAPDQPGGAAPPLHDESAKPAPGAF